MERGNYERIMVLLAVIMGAITGICSANNITVGDQTGWTIPSTSSFYSTWGSKQNFQVGDVLVFNFPANKHTVAEVSKESYDTCNTTKLLSVALTTSPASITLNNPGLHYFLCTIGTHCSSGQKLQIVATGPSSAAPQPSSASPQPSSTTSPSIPTTTDSQSSPPPPPSNFASPTAAGVGLLSFVSLLAAALTF